MSDKERSQGHGADSDASSEFVRDFAQSPPAKSIETVKAASNVVEKVDHEKHEALVRERAFRLWDRAGRPDGRHDEFWREAEAAIEKETSEG